MGESSNNAARLKVVGVGGAGGNAINDMIESDITDVDFVAVNTDAQDLARSKAETKVLLGEVSERERILKKQELQQKNQKIKSEKC